MQLSALSVYLQKLKKKALKKAAEQKRELQNKFNK